MPGSKRPVGPFATLDEVERLMRKSQGSRVLAAFLVAGVLLALLTAAWLVGPFSPGQGAKYIKSGAIREGFIWNPMLAGEVIVYVGDKLAKGETPTDGMEIPGLGPVKVDPATRNIMAQKLQPINKDTIDELVGMGL